MLRKEFTMKESCAGMNKRSCNGQKSEKATTKRKRERSAARTRKTAMRAWRKVDMTRFRTWWQAVYIGQKSEFWKTILKADKYILDMLENGYKLPFMSGQEPERYREKNNKSAMKHMGFAVSEVEKWAKKRVVLEVYTEPWCVSPLTVAERMIGEQEKLRLCLDLSRYINKLLKKEAVKLAGLDTCTQALLPGDYIATYDLSSAFHHVKIFEPHQKFLGFSLPGKEPGDPDRYFIFLVMPFGLASAVKCITRITRPLCCYLADKGIRHSIYIDDGNALARTLALLLKHLEIILETLDKAGFVIAREKTDSAATVSQVKVYLGFVLDSTKMEVRVTEEKIQDARKAIMTVANDQAGAKKAKLVAKAIGKVVAMEAAMGPIVQLLSRSAQAELAQATERHWNVYMQLSETARHSLRQLAQALDTHNGYPIKNMATAKRLEAFVEPSAETAGKSAPQPLLGMRDLRQRLTVMAGDASAKATCALQVSQAARYFNQTLLSEEETKLSSGQRELLTVLRALQQDKEFFATLKNETVIWLTDSTNLVSFLTKGTTKMSIQQQVLQVFQLLSEYKIRLVPIHLRRTDFRIQWADEGSREFDPDDWSVDAKSYKELTRSWTPTVDLFTHSTNRKCKKFYSYGDAPYSAGIDAFSQSWENELAWICPPVYLIPEALKKIENTKMMAILVVPVWKAAAFWPLLFPDGKHGVECCVSIRLFRPHVVRGQFCQNKLMQGRTAFPFLAVYMRSAGEGHTHRSGAVTGPIE